MRLRTRLLAWFAAAIVFAAVTSALVVALTHPEAGVSPGPVVARGIATRLARTWDDERACEGYVEAMRETTGFDLRLRRDPTSLPPIVQRAGRRAAGTIVFTPDEGAFIPVVRGGALVGAVQLEASGGPAAQLGWWRVAAALCAGTLVLVVAAERVARAISRPLEQVSDAAARLGAGDLRARARDPDARAAAGAGTGADGGADGGADEVQRVARVFDAMADRIEGVVRDQRELLGAVSHELRSPLGRARVALEIARDRAAGGSSPEGVARALDDADRQLVEADTLLGDLLAVARAGLTDLRREEVDLVGWLRERTAELASSGPVELIVEPSPGGAGDPGVRPLRASIDATLLARALHNLVANARRHGHPADVPVTVALRAVGRGRARVAVRDAGEGIPEELLPRIFEPFVRGGDPARTSSGAAGGGGGGGVVGGGGVGLGLTLVRRIVEAHGGSVFAAARRGDGRGAEVGFELPLL